MSSSSSFAQVFHPKGGFRPYILAFSASWASATYGYDAAFIGGTIVLPSFVARFGLDKATAANLISNIVSTFQAGAFFGAIFSFLVSETLGRKSQILGSISIFCLGVILQIIGASVAFIYAGRALTGLAIGISLNVLPVYIAECSPRQIRGRLVGIADVMIQIGLVVGYWINYGVNKNISPKTDTQWRVPIGVQFIPAGLVLLTVPFLPESPRWLASRGRLQQARSSLAWIRKLETDHHDVDRELEEIQQSIVHEIETTGGNQNMFQILREALQPGIRNRIAIGAIIMTLANFSGVNAINYYSPILLKSLGIQGTSVALLGTGIYGIVKCVATIIFIFFVIDKFGRRPALLLGAIGAMTSMFYLAVYSKLSGSFYHPVKDDAGSHAALAMIYVFAVFFAFSWNNVPWVLAAEILPNRVRALGMMIAVAVNWLMSFVVVYALPYMLKGIGYGTFILFGACLFTGLVFAFFFVPETKGASLEDMDILFGVDAPLLAANARKRYEQIQAERARRTDDEAAKPQTFEHVE